MVDFTLTNILWTDEVGKPRQRWEVTVPVDLTNGQFIALLRTAKYRQG